MKFIEFFIRQSKVTNLILLLIISAGLYVFINGRKEAFPGFVVNEIYISTLYPGASARTIENKVTYPIEKKVKNITGIKKIESSSKENLCTIILTIDTEYEGRLDEIKNDIKNAIDEMIFNRDLY